MYLVPRAKENSEIDLIAVGTIAACTLSTLTNIANWYFASNYFNVG